MINVEPTASIIDDMAYLLTQKASELKRIAVRMRESQDLSYASEAINIIADLMPNLRLDLLITRPLREYTR